MIKTIGRVLAIGLIVLSQITLISQSNNDQEFLSKIGLIDSLYSEVLGEYRKVYIQMPIGYNAEQNKKYPVAFILDGGVFISTVNEVQSFYSGGFTPEMILVGIANDKNRDRDLTISKIETRNGRPFRVESGGADKFRSFIETELIPYIEEKYPVTNYRTLIGHSHGGLFTIATLIHQPELFANYLAIDPSLDWDNQLLIKQAKEKLTEDAYNGKSLFFSLSGQLHMQNDDITIDNVMQDTTDFTLFARSSISFLQMLDKAQLSGLTHKWKYYPNDLHGTIPLPSIMDGLIDMFQWYQMENTDKINSFDTPRDELFKVITHRENKLRDHFGYFEAPYPEEVLNILGYMSMEMNALDKARMYFEFAIQYFPDSVNAYDSMAEYYESQDDSQYAIKYLEKAYELSGNKQYQVRINAQKNK